MKESGTGDHSLEDRVAREHEQLEPLFEATRQALMRRERTAAFDSMGELRQAVETHTAQEDQLYYPALWSLCPQHKDALELFIRSHARFRTELEEIVRCITGDDLLSAAGHFEVFSKSFATHEVYEEELLREIDAESPRSDPAPTP